MEATDLSQRTYGALATRLAHAGFSAQFLRDVLLPDWWDASCAEDPRLLTDLELRVARFLDLPVRTVQTPGIPLAAPHYPGARLRHLPRVHQSRLRPAVHAGLQVAAAAVRAMGTAPEVRMPPADALAYRAELLRAHALVDLACLVRDLWSRGIPSLHVELLPNPRFQGMACIIEHRPVVLLGHGHDTPARLAFHLVHELGHVVSGDCQVEAPVVDLSEDVGDTSDMEVTADGYALAVLGGSGVPPAGLARGAREAATSAYELERQTRVDAGHVLLRWAEETGDFATAQQALRALWRSHGGRLALREGADDNLDLDGAPDTDRALLRCLYDDPARDAAPA